MNAMILAAWLAAAGDMPPSVPPAKPDPAEDDPTLPVRCNGTVCIVPQDKLLLLAQANNWKFDRIRELEAQLAAKGCKPLPALKKDRDS